MVSRNRKVSEDQEEAVVAAYLDGVGAPVLSRRYGCSPTVIYRILERHGVRRHRRGTPNLLTPEQERDMLAAYTAGEPKALILKRYGISEGGFFKVRRRHGVATRPATPTGSTLFSPEQEQPIVDGYRDGRSLADLGRANECSLEAIRKCLKRHGVARRPRGNTLRVFTDDEIDHFAARWNAGESQHSIGKSVGLSQTQISSLLRHLDAPPEVRIARGAGHGAWKGGRVSQGDGYIAVRMEIDDPLRPMVNVQGYVLEHRLVMARSLGRPLTASETVHHINGDRADNRLENLQLRRGRHGKGSALTCADCGSHNIVDAPLAEAPR